MPGIVKRLTAMNCMIRISDTVYYVMSERRRKSVLPAFLLFHLPAQKPCRRNGQFMFGITHLPLFIFIGNDHRADGVSLADNRGDCLGTLFPGIVQSDFYKR